MPIDISKYTKTTRLSNMLDVAGYVHVVFSGAAVYYKARSGEPKESEDIDYLNAGGDSL